MSNDNDSIATKFCQKEEIFNANVLNYIIHNFEQLKQQIGWEQTDETHQDPLSLAKKYISISKNGVVRVVYRQNGGRGRFCAVGSLSLQNMPKWIRHAIAHEYYEDIDMVNAHPVILAHLCKINNFECKYLDKYVAAREATLSLLIGQDIRDDDGAITKVNADKAKQILLAIINGGNKDFKRLIKAPAFLVSFKAEMIRIHKQFANLFNKDFEAWKGKRIINKTDFNHEASFMNTLMCDMENDILHIMLEFFNNPQMVVLCFDGLMMRKLDEGAYDLTACSAYIKSKLGIDMCLKIKKMNCLFDIQEIPYKQPRLKYFEDKNNVYIYDEHEKNTASIERLDEWAKCINIISRGGDQVFMTLNLDIDEVSGEHNEYFVQIDKKNTLLNSLDVECIVRNPFYIEDSKGKNNPHTKKNIYAKLGPDYLKKQIEARNIKEYADFMYYPFLKRIGIPYIHSNKLNLFMGFPMDAIPFEMVKTKYNFEESNLYKHLKTDFFTDGDAEFNNFLDHMADMIQKPNINRGVGHLFYSVQGTGKGLLAKFAGRLLGAANLVVIKDFCRYMEKFNMMYSNKILKVFEELPEKGGAFTMSDKLKSHIDQKDEIIEPKGGKQYTVKHFARYWFFTNNENTLYIEGSDRRYSLHKLSNKHADDKTYFQPIIDEINNDDFVRCSFEYFATRSYNEIDVMTAYKTKYKTEQKMSNLPKGIKFMIDYIENEYDEISNEDDYISAKALCDRYRGWCDESGSKYNKCSLLTQLKHIGIDEPKRIKRGADRVLMYKINGGEILESVRTYLKHPEFNFNFVKDE